MKSKENQFIKVEKRLTRLRVWALFTINMIQYPETYKYVNWVLFQWKLKQLTPEILFELTDELFKYQKR